MSTRKSILIFSSLLMIIVLSSSTILPSSMARYPTISGVLPTLADAPITGQITVLSDIVDGVGSYHDPFVINDTTVEWRVDVEGDNKTNALYRIDVHMEYYRSCSTQVSWDNLTYQDLIDRNGRFSYTASMAGWYYLRIDVNENGTYQELYDARVRVYFQVPPINPYTLPYTPPLENHEPLPQANILNAISGTGSYVDPFVIDSPIVEFRIDGSDDPDGIDDLKNGVFTWAIHTKGYHPVYAKGEQAMEAKDTFLYYPEIIGTIYHWDTQERPSEDGIFYLYVSIIDQHGAWATKEIHFVVSKTCSCSNWVDLGCGQSICSQDEMYQARSCSPAGCSLETRCQASPICQANSPNEDINQDGRVNALDVQLCVNVIMETETRPEIVERADVNDDDVANGQDIVLIINKIID